MADEFSFVSQQLDLYRSQAEALEDRKQASDQAMAGEEIEDIIALGLSVIRNLRRHKQRLSVDKPENHTILCFIDTRGRRREFSWHDGHRLAAFYRNWQEATESLQHIAAVYEQHGLELHGAKQLRDEVVSTACRKREPPPADPDTERRR